MFSSISGSKFKNKSRRPPRDSFGAILGLIFGPFLVSFLGPKTGPNSGPLLDRFLDSVLAPKCDPNRLQGTPKSEQKTQKHAKTSSKWLCISSSSALRKSYKNTLFYDGSGASKLPKATRREPKGAHEAVLYAQKRPRGQHKSHSASELRKRHEKDTRKDPRNDSQTGQNQGPKKGPRRACDSLRKPAGPAPASESGRALILSNV